MKVVLKSKQIESMLNGFVATNEKVEVLPKTGIVCLKKQDAAVVPIISGGGSGHEPAHFGFVGKGMLSAAISGEIFEPPHYEDILTAIRKVDQGRGVFVIEKNFDADLAMFSKAITLARAEGRIIRYIVSHDDISVDSTNNYEVRHRGVAGTILLHKILGEAAQRGQSITEIERIAFELSTSIFTIGATKSAVTIPGQDCPVFQLPQGEISLGIGIHGESGYRQEPFVSLEYLANELINKLKIRCRWKKNDAYIVLINNLGGFSESDQFLFTNAVMNLLELEDIEVQFIKTKKLLTSLDMQGISITMCPVKHTYWLDFLKADTDAPAW